MKKALLLALPLVLAACGSSPSTRAPTGDANLGDGPLTVTGRIQNYSPSKGSTLYAFYGASTARATGGVDSNGNFSIDLPVPSPAEFKTLSSILVCSGSTVSRNVTITPDTAGIRFPTLSLSSSGTSSVLLATDPAAASGSLTLYAYSPQSTDATGSFTCSAGGGTLQNQVNLHFVRGWNIVVLDASGSGVSGQISYYTASAPPPGSTWLDAGYISDLPGQSVRPIALQQAAQELWH